MPLTVGTAGHVDHGKTWLVRALTGVDTDRLPEEQARGISIELGYAPLDLPDGRRLSLVDVPGHERFVRTMVAGATGIDLFLLVVDAGEGARPQTHEHLAVLRLLGVDRGVVAVTKADAVDAGALALALDEARELVPDADVVPVSARTGDGLEELRAALAQCADRAAGRPADGPARLHADRVFTLRGIGTVVTGTLLAGSIGRGDELVAEPRGVRVRVRSVEVHDRDVGRAEAGQRVALALPGLGRDELRRGDALVAPGAYPVGYRLDVALEELEPVADGTRLVAHHGTAAIAARVVRVGDRFAQLRLAQPVVAARGDRVVLRGETTVAGALVLDPAPPRGREPERLRVLASGDARRIAATMLREPTRRRDLEARGLLSPAELDQALAPLERAGDWYLPPGWLDELRASAHTRAAERARETPLEPGISVTDAVGHRPWAAAVVPLLGLEQRGAALHLPGATPAAAAAEPEARALEEALAAAEPSPVRTPDRRLAALLEAEGRLVRVGDGLAVSRAAYERARTLVLEECERAGSIGLARFRDLLGTGRRDAQLLLERLDADGVTRRRGDVRVLRRSAITER